MTDGVFVPAAAVAGRDAPPAFLPARPITQADLAAVGVGEAWLPRDYVPDFRAKIDIYRRLSRATAERQVDDLAAELSVRFGPVPDEARRLLDFARLRCRAIGLGIDSITRHPGMIMIGHHDRERIEIERTLITASGVTAAADTPSASRPRLGGISFLHRFGSALNRHVHLHACVTDGVFVPAADDAGCDATPAFLPARPITAADLAALTERVRRRVIRWFRLTRLIDAAAAAEMLAWEDSGFSIDASVRITLIDRDVPSYFQSLEHLLRYCARPPFALDRLSVTRDASGRIAKVRYVLPRHKAANWVGPGRGRKSTRPGANGVVELTPFEFLDRLADLVPPPRKHRHRYHGVFTPNHPLRPAVTALAIGNIGKRQEAAADGHATDGHGTGGCCDSSHEHQRPRSHDTSRIAWAKLMARVGEEFPLECPACGGDIRLIAFITEPGPIRKILTHLGEPLEPPPVSPARGPPTNWSELVQVHDHRDAYQASPDELPAIDIHSL